MYSPRIELALTTVLEAHRLNRRKAGRGFEATHVLAVGLITRDFGFGEDAVVAGFLHDTLEDTSLEPDVIADRFGDHVLAVVPDVTELPKTHPWRALKEAYIDRLRQSPHDDAWAVATADKIHNLSSMTNGLERQGPAFVDAFTAGLDDMAWYQRAVYTMLATDWTHAILDEHARQLERFLTVAALTTP